MKFYTIYQITDLVNNKIYIGKHETDNINDNYMGSGKLLIRAQKKHGLENFRKEILHVFKTEEEMNAKEAELVTEEFCLREDTYNLCPGGKGGWGYINSEGLAFGGNKLLANKRGAEQQRKYLEDTFGVINMFQVPAVKEKLSKKLKDRHKLGQVKIPSFKGKQHKQDTKFVMSQKSKGENNSQYGSMWISNGLENKKIKSIDFIPDGWYKGRVIKK